MKKILLINPPVPNILRESLPPVVEDDSGLFPPLGLLYLAAYVEGIEGCSVQILDCQAEEMGHNDLHEVIRGISPDVIGIQVMTFTLIDAAIVAKTARNVVPDAYIVCGGPHPTIFPKETIDLPNVDAVIRGEGEYVFSELVKAIVSGKAPESAEGVITQNRRDVTHSLEYIEDLDVLKLPARHLIDTAKYSSPLAKSSSITTIMSSRGCPARCVFCDRPQMGKKFRKRSAAKVVEEMRYCKEQLRIDELFFYDDTFTIDRKRVSDICEMIIDSAL
ncbi:MAG: cobalamin-dependent protein, partial [Dehalococcoidia bacterium]